jgi:hypothetical protein
LLDGSAGSVLDMNTLPSVQEAITQDSVSSSQYLSDMLSPKSNEKLFISKPLLQIVAFNSLTRTYVVQVQPEIRVIYRWQAPLEVRDEISGGIIADRISSLDWNWNLQWSDLIEDKDMTISNSKDIISEEEEMKLNNRKKSVYNPLLVRSWGGVVQLLSMIGGKKEEFEFNIIAEKKINNLNILSSKWIKSGFIIILSTTKLSLLSQNLEIIEQCNLIPSIITSLTTSLECRNGLDQPLPSTLCVDSEKLYILSPESIVNFYLQSWVEVVDEFIKNGQWLEALTLALDSTSRKSSNNSNNIINKNHLDKYIQNYVNLAISQSSPISSFDSNAPSSNHTTQSRNHYHLVAGICMEYCITADRLNLLFGSLYDIFVLARQEIVFLDSLEPQILLKNITILPPHIISKLFEVTVTYPSRISSVERIISYLTINHGQVDLTLIIRFLIKHNMYSSLLYVYSYGLNDFGGAYKIIYEKMINFPIVNSDQIQDNNEEIVVSKFPSPSQAEIGYKLILHLQYTSEGKSYPHGDVIGNGSFNYLRLYDLIKTILSKSISLSPISSQLCTHPLAKMEFPYIYAITKIDASASIYCISKAIKSLSVVIETIINEILQKNSKNEIKSKETKLESEPLSDNNHIISELYYQLFKFCQYSDKRLSINDEILHLFFENCLNSIIENLENLKIELIIAIIKYCATFVTPIVHSEDLICMLIKHQIQYCNQIKFKQIKEKLELHNYWRASLLLQNYFNNNNNCRKLFNFNINDFKNGIESYIKLIDNSNMATTQLFTFIDTLYVDIACNDTKLTHDYNIILCRYLIKFTQYDIEQTKRIVCSYLLNNITDIIQETNENELIQYQLLDVVIKVATINNNNNNENFSSTDLLRYIRLLILHSPHEVYSFISTHDQYPLDECLELCKEHDVADAVSYLMEREGNTNEALNLLLIELSKLLTNARKELDAQLRNEVLISRSGK